MPPAARPAESPARRALRLMLLRVFALHVAAIAGHQLARVAQRPAGVRTAYLAVWMLLTVAIVGAGLYRVSAARRASRAARAAAREGARGAP